jgi:hypothetical protein
MRAETKRHREGHTSALERGGTQEVTEDIRLSVQEETKCNRLCVQAGAGHLHRLAEALAKVPPRLGGRYLRELGQALVRVPQKLGGWSLPWCKTVPAVAY